MKKIIVFCLLLLWPALGLATVLINEDFNDRAFPTLLKIMKSTNGSNPGTYCTGTSCNYVTSPNHSGESGYAIWGNHQHAYDFIWFPVGYQSSTITNYIEQGLYIRYYIQYSSTYQSPAEAGYTGSPNVKVLKLANGTTGLGADLEMIWISNSMPYTRLWMQWFDVNGTIHTLGSSGSNSASFAANPVAKGGWDKIEIYVRIPSGGSAQSEFHVQVNDINAYNYVAPNYLSLRGGNDYVATPSVRASVGNLATVESLWYGDDITVVVGEGDLCNNEPAPIGDPSPDTTAPTITNATVTLSGTQVLFTYSEAATRGAGYANSNFNLDDTTGSINDIALTYVSGDGTVTHTYTIASTIAPGHSINLDFTGTSNSIEDAAGNDLAAITSGAVTNNSAADIIVPTLSSVVVSSSGTSTVFNFSETVTESGTGSDWAFVMSGGAVTLSAPIVNGSAVSYTNSRTIGGEETKTSLAYTQPGNGIQDSGGNDLATIASYSGTFTNNGPTADIVDPVITRTDPADNPYVSTTTQYVTVSGTSSDDVLVSSVAASCPTCQSTGAVTGTTTWSVPIIISQGALGSDLLYNEGAFGASGAWDPFASWAIGSGVASNDGSASNAWLTHSVGVEVGSIYQVSYTVSGYTSGDLYLSKYGFGGNGTTGSVLLNTANGPHTVDVTCVQIGSLIFNSYLWTGELDNVTVKKLQYDTLTMTATDSSNNTKTTTIQLGYVPPESIVPRKVVGLSATGQWISLGGGKILEF